MLKGKKILVGITGSIAAYKSILLVRLLVKAGATVKVLMTPDAKNFVTPLTLSTLSKNDVVCELTENDSWANHVMLGRWADVLLIAPLSCNTLAKMAIGICDNLLMAVYLSATCPVAVAPAMDEDMWKHPTTKRNIAQIKNDGVAVVKVNNGELASGLFGEGRMAEPEKLFSYLVETYFRSEELKGKKALITAGPTYEAIDPVRFIGNHSSGKMGFALAEELYLRGAEVVLVSGPSALTPKYDGIKLQRTTSAAQMYEACLAVFAQTDITIMSAAVADYYPMQQANEKIKKKNEEWSLTLAKTKDILAQLGSLKQKGQVLIGFALETNNELDNAMVKLESKNADAIVLNSLNDEGAGFGVDTNQVTIVHKKGKWPIGLKSKAAVATDIVSFIINDLHA